MMKRLFLIMAVLMMLTGNVLAAEPVTLRWWTFEPPKPGEAASQGGFYTQDDIREIVQYAADRQISVLPEIDIPGHSLAMIAAYPEVSNTKKQ